MSSLANRMVRAAKSDVNLYEEVEEDQQAMGQAMGVVVLASLASRYRECRYHRYQRVIVWNRRCPCRVAHLGIYH